MLYLGEEGKERRERRGRGGREGKEGGRHYEEGYILMFHY